LKYRVEKLIKGQTVSISKTFINDDLTQLINTIGGIKVNE